MKNRAIKGLFEITFLRFKNIFKLIKNFNYKKKNLHKKKTLCLEQILEALESVLIEVFSLHYVWKRLTYNFTLKINPNKICNRDADI